MPSRSSRDIQYLSKYSVTELVQRLKRCDDGWVRAMRNVGYRDEESSDKPFTDAERVRMYFTQAWRIAYNETERALMNSREVRLGLIEGLQVREEFTIFESD